MSKENVLLFNTAYDYLKGIVKNDKRLKNINLESYFIVERPDSLTAVYKRFIGSAQNYQMMPNVINFYSREKEISKVLYGYDLKKISKMSEDDLYRQFREKFNVTTADSKRNSWYKWSCAVIDSARFISGFGSLNEFDKFIMKKYDSDDSRKVLASMIEKRIRWMGFALICDALKELGYTRYSKPDVHTRDVFSSIGLCNNDEYSVCEAIEKMAEDCKTMYPGIHPYKVDKVFWLICSGKFYKSGVKAASKKNELIELLKAVRQYN